MLDSLIIDTGADIDVPSLNNVQKVGIAVYFLIILPLLFF